MAIKIDTLKFGEILLLSFVAVELISFILNAISPSIPILSGGFILIIFSVVIFLIYLLTLSLNINQIQIKRDIPILVILLGVIGLMYFFLPLAVPQLYQVSGNTGTIVRNFLAGNIGSVINYGSTNVVG